MLYGVEVLVLIGLLKTWRRALQRVGLRVVDPLIPGSSHPLPLPPHFQFLFILSALRQCEYCLLERYSLAATGTDLWLEAVSGSPSLGQLICSKVQMCFLSQKAHPRWNTCGVREHVWIHPVYCGPVFAINLSFFYKLEAHLGIGIKHFSEATVLDADLFLQTFLLNQCICSWNNKMLLLHSEKCPQRRQ